MRQSSASSKTHPEAPRLLNQVRDKIRLKHYSIRTEQAYTDWIRRFILYHEKRHPAEMGAVEVEQFLTHLAVTGKFPLRRRIRRRALCCFCIEMCWKWRCHGWTA